MSTPPGRPAHDLLGGPAPTYLPAELHEPAEGELGRGRPVASVAAAHPASSLAWAVLAEGELAAADEARAAGRDEERLAHAVAAYAYARTGYHRGLDALRRSGWKGRGPVPWEHAPNRGYLRSVRALAGAAEHVGEAEEVARLRDLLLDGDPSLA
ncbi:DUF3151 domain-containing protein [Aquipuribacter sp. SD81]|uniref:DUF3151 domain-containing protein n=1 Tax=Aquipuribacter sp. SD81 TaxID=3127703 RepID=UPI003019AE8E